MQTSTKSFNKNVHFKGVFFTCAVAICPQTKLKNQTASKEQILSRLNKYIVQTSITLVRFILPFQQANKERTIAYTALVKNREPFPVPAGFIPAYPYM